MRTTRRTGPGALLLAAAVLAGCGSGVDGGDDAGPATGDGAPSGVEAALSFVPATEGAADFVVVNDIAAAADAAGLTAPDPGASEQEVGAYLSPLSGVGDDATVAVAPSDLLIQSAIDDAGWRDEVGFGVIDLSGDVTSGQPPDDLQTFFGDFDEDAVEQAVTTDPSWSGQLDEVEHGDATYYSWGDDGAVDVSGVSTVRRLGESARLFVDDGAGVAYWANTTATMEAALDTFAGDAPSLADDPELGPMAAALDGLGAYSAILTADGGAFQAGAGAPAATGDGPSLEPYEAVATGAAVVDGRARLLVVLVNADEATAQANADLLAQVVAEGSSAVNGRPWSDALGEGEITVDGTVVAASFPTDDPRLWNGVVVTRDTLLAAS